VCRGKRIAPPVLKVLVDNFKLGPVITMEADLKAALAGG
jgi:hydroxylamine reductase (hybrid-cluster protein)